MIAWGYRNKVIAAKLDVAENTIEVHVHNIISKLGTYNQTAAASIFLEARALAPPAPRELILLADLF